MSGNLCSVSQVYSRSPNGEASGKPSQTPTYSTDHIIGFSGPLLLSRGVYVCLAPKNIAVEPSRNMCALPFEFFGQEFPRKRFARVAPNIACMGTHMGRCRRLSAGACYSLSGAICALTSRSVAEESLLTHSTNR